MAKRRSKEQLNSDRIIKARLLEMGEKIYTKAVSISRRDTGRLQDEMNYRVEPDTTLNFAQMYYGKYNYPAGVESGQKNALLIVIEENIDDLTNVIMRDIADGLTVNFKK